MQVADALRERAQRIYDKYGNVMLETEGMTKAGIERKATCRALFSKLLYLAGECAAPHACAAGSAHAACSACPIFLRLAVTRQMLLAEVLLRRNGTAYVMPYMPCSMPGLLIAVWHHGAAGLFAGSAH